MPDETIIDDGWLDHVEVEQTLDGKLVEQAKPLTLNVDARPQPTSWFTIGLLCAVAFFAGLQLRSCDLPIPTPTPDDDTIVIDDEGKFVMILRDNSESGQNALTDGQEQAITSTKVSSWCRSNGFEFRIVDVEDKIDSMEPVWVALKAQASKAPSLTAAKDGKAFSTALPDGIDETIQALEALQ